MSLSLRSWHDLLLGYLDTYVEYSYRKLQHRGQSDAPAIFDPKVVIDLHTAYHASCMHLSRTITSLSNEPTDPHKATLFPTAQLEGMDDIPITNRLAAGYLGFSLDFPYESGLQDTLINNQ